MQMLHGVPKIERALRVLSWAGAWGQALADGVSRPFAEATGVAVEPIRHVGLRLPDALVAALERRSRENQDDEGERAALEAGRQPPVDVVWCNTSPALRAAARGWCEPLDGAPVLDELAARARWAVPDGRAAGGHRWPIAPTYVTHYVLVYRTALYPAGPPTSWRALERAAHAGRVVLYPGGNGFYPVAQVLGGGAPSQIPHDMAACWATVRLMRGQLGRPDYSIGLHEVIRRGEIDLCYRALPNVLAFQADGLAVDWTAPREGIADTTDAMWIPRGLPPDVRACARAYIEHALSAQVQDRWCQLMGTLPINRHARARSAAFARPGMPRDADDLDGILYVPEPVKASHEPAWEAMFDQLTAGPRVA